MGSPTSTRWRDHQKRPLVEDAIPVVDLPALKRPPRAVSLW